MMSEKQVARLPYWEYMRISEPNEISLDNIELSILVGDLALRVKKLEEEIAWLRRDNTVLTGAGAMD